MIAKALPGRFIYACVIAVVFATTFTLGDVYATSGSMTACPGGSGSVPYISEYFNGGTHAKTDQQNSNCVSVGVYMRKWEGTIATTSFASDVNSSGWMWLPTGNATVMVAKHQKHGSNFYAWAYSATTQHGGVYDATSNWYNCGQATC